VKFTSITPVAAKAAAVGVAAAVPVVVVNATRFHCGSASTDLADDCGGYDRNQADRGGTAVDIDTVSAFCDQCGHDLLPKVIEREAARVLRHLIPG
jgi:hypothetical protein